MTGTTRFLVDEDFDNDILRGLLRRLPKTDVVRVQDVGLSGAPDSAVLAWAADNDRVLLTHDVSTMTMYAAARTRGGLRMPGIFVVSQSLAIGAVIDDLALIAACSLPGEWEGQIRFLPL